MIIATAGHVDHGKTTLVKALTGLDTDRLPEEKARGISIDLGFAHARLASGEVASFIDVPGHERFIHNMLAGVGAIDAALVIVAADDGVMPQTVEHVHILDLLQVTRGIAVVTKVDCVAPARAEAVRREVAALLSTTTMANSPVIAASAMTGEGLPELGALLANLQVPSHLADASGQDKHLESREEGRHFRLAIDRAFTVAGSGTVVTGTILAGRLAPGDELVISPRGTRVRVRGVQVHGEPVEVAQAGQRCAINLAGAGLDQVARGDWLVHAAVHAPTQRFDTRLRVLASEAQPLAHWTPVHLHIGTADVLARVTIANEGSVRPGQSAVVQLVADRPLGALHGDRFVIRDQSARRTIGGGSVLDPFSERRRRGATLRSGELAALERDTPAAILAGLLEISERGVDLARFARSLNVTEERMARIVGEADAAILGKEPVVGVTRAYAEVLRTQVLQALRCFHEEQPQAAGMEVARLHRHIAPHLARTAFHHLVRELANRRALVLSNDLAGLPGHDTTSNPADERLWRSVRPHLLRAGFHAPTVAELAARMKAKEGALRDFLHRKSRTGEVMRVAAERFFLRETLATLAATAQALARSSKDGLFSAAQFRDAIGSGRGLAIHILEHFDRLGITQRIGNQRRTGKDFAPILGMAEPLVSPPPPALPRGDHPRPRHHKTPLQAP